MRKVLIVILLVVGLGLIGLASYKWLFPNLNAENRQIKTWIETSNLNEYGDAANTVYSNSKPCLDAASCFNYIKKMHPDKPWEK